jgi:hypothetical protein
MAAAQLPPRIMAEQPDRALNALGAMLKAWRLVPTGTEGYAKAEVMRGGVDTNALSQRTMEARAVPGLFVVGRRWTSPAGSAATTSSGPGRAAGWRARRREVAPACPGVTAEQFGWVGSRLPLG